MPSRSLQLLAILTFAAYAPSQRIMRRDSMYSSVMGAVRVKPSQAIYSRTSPRYFKPARLGLALIATLLSTSALRAQDMTIHNAAGLQMSVDIEDANPALSITVPDGPVNERSFKILLPEHVTIRAHGQAEAKHLYIFSPGPQNTTPHWKKVKGTLEYATDFGDIHFIARATLVDDGILFHYDFANHSDVDYDMVTAITDPRFRTVFYDPRLERTYVHHKEGFDLLASETPERLSMPLKNWLPVRYHASYTAPVPAERVQHRNDGITYRYKSRTVDVPMIATLSTDRTWVAASFSSHPGNVWSNPELTCQHVDREVSLPPNSNASSEVKILIFRGSLEDAFRKVSVQLPALR